MARLVKSNYLNNFVKPVSEGGWGLCETIVSYMAQNRPYEDTEIYQKIQDDGVLAADIKALPIEDITKVIEYMQGKEFSGVLVLHDDKITYELPVGTP